MTFIQNELNFKTGLLDFSQKVGEELDRVPSNVITSEEYNEIYDKNFLVSKPGKDGVFRKLQTPAAPHPGQALLGAAEKKIFNNHITVKPLSLIEHLIKLFSKKDALVVDPFLGSGTTAVACINTGRKCIGMEIEEEYYNICLQRVGVNGSL